MPETFTFDNTLSTDLAKVRLAIGDFWAGTTAKNPLLSDETINALIADSDTLLAAQIRGVDAILTIFGREADSRSAASMSVAFSTRYTAFKDIKANLEAQQGGEFPTSEYVAGRTYSERDTLEADTDIIQPTGFSTRDRGLYSGW